MAQLARISPFPRPRESLAFPSICLCRFLLFCWPGRESPNSWTNRLSGFPHRNVHEGRAATSTADSRVFYAPPGDKLPVVVAHARGALLFSQTAAVRTYIVRLPTSWTLPMFHRLIDDFQPRGAACFLLGRLCNLIPNEADSIRGPFARLL